MENIEEIENYYQSIMGKLRSHLPEGIYFVDLEFLQELDLLDFKKKSNEDLFLSEEFKMVETPDKITVINEDFLIWIVPSGIIPCHSTQVFIALNHDPEPKVEAGFIATGVYNSSKIVINVLEKILIEIKENEELIDRFQEVM